MTRVSVMLFLVGYSALLVDTSARPAIAVDADFDAEKTSVIASISVSEEQERQIRDDTIRQAEALLMRVRFLEKRIRDDVERREKQIASPRTPRKLAENPTPMPTPTFAPLPTPTPRPGGLRGLFP